jgi:D-alanyl-lipoteichoic acid acyltransferase DltB (MBOAT superfamily)
MVTMLLGGLWHGATWTFVVWGDYHGTLLAIYRMFGQTWDKLP